MKKILITIDALEQIRDNVRTREEWNIDRILTWGTDINASLDNLPEAPEITFFIPAIINTNNAIAYDGAKLALRILFNYISRYGHGINIVLMGTETKEAFLFHSPYPNILKIPGIRYCLLNRFVVSKISTDEKNLPLKEYISYIENLGLKRPSSFRSNHSLTNEWCLYKWSTFMEMPDAAINDQPQLLYFDYLKAIERICNVKNRLISNNPSLQRDIAELKEEDARILLVDDNAGWHCFFKSFFKGANIQFETIGVDFKKKSLEEVKDMVLRKVGEFRPDVILLDFRLIEDRDADCKFEDISGTQILKALKGTFDNPGANFGRQVLLFTATSRIENILRLKKLGADGFILKEKSEQYASKEITKDRISRMVRDIQTAIDRAKFLIPLNEKLVELKKTGESLKDGSEYIRNAIETVSNSIRLTTQGNDLNFEILKLVFLTLFTILEIVKSNESRPKEYRGILDFIQHTAPNEILSVWNDLDNLRNSLAHGDPEVEIGRKMMDITTSMIQSQTLELRDFINRYVENHDRH